MLRSKILDVLKRGKDYFREWLFQRRTAYRQVFDPERPATKLVLRDLADFCHAHTSTMHSDARAQAAQEAKRDVWLRIQYHLQLTDEQLWELYGDGEEL